MTASTFGTLLRRWRDRLSPADAGLPAGPSRRAPGLRREELAQLAGLSMDYVLRLEQGRARHPSAQVVGALARALQTSREERDELYRAAGLLPPRDGTISTHVPSGVQRLAARLGDVPIAVFATDWTLLLWNDLWGALHGDPGSVAPGDRNLARTIFAGTGGIPLRPMRSDGTAGFLAAIVSDLKEAASRYPADAALAQLVRELRQSAEFERLWAVSSPSRHVSHRKTITHPEVGDILFDCDVLTVPGSDLRIVAYTTASGSDDASKLDLLRVTGGVTAPRG